MIFNDFIQQRILRMKSHQIEENIKYIKSEKSFRTQPRCAFVEPRCAFVESRCAFVKSATPCKGCEGGGAGEGGLGWAGGVGGGGDRGGGRGGWPWPQGLGPVLALCGLGLDCLFDRILVDFWIFGPTWRQVRFPKFVGDPFWRVLVPFGAKMASRRPQECPKDQV